MRGHDIIVEPIRLADIFIVGKRRDLRPEAVDALATSIETLGLRHPISIRYVDYLNHPTEGELHGAYVLVAGRHRLAAYEKLGRERIECVVVKWGEDEARLWEIAENLHRADLTRLERDEQIAEWIAIKESAIFATCENSKTGPKGAVNKAAEELPGVNKDAAYRAVKVASISEQARQAAVDAHLDNNQSALLKIARAPVAEQVAVVREIAEAKALRTEQDIKNRAAQEIAELLAAHIPGDAWDVLRSNMQAAGNVNLILSAFNNLVGNSVMDRRHS